MPYTLEQLAGSIRERGQFTGTGIGFAGGYINTLVGPLGKSGLAGHLKMSQDQLVKALKAAGGQFVFRDPAAEVTAAIIKGADGIAVTGKSDRTEAEFRAIKASSLMEFENVLTAAGTDRDGDDLDPKGAQVDPSAPLLWQHLPNEPIGKMFKVIQQDNKIVKTHCGIADTALGHDAAVLADYGALRISHGFKPKEFEPKGNKDSGEDGWNIYKYEVMEVSLVSIPANVGAVITAFEKGKLGTGLVKSWAAALQSERPLIVKGGWSKTEPTAPPATKSTDTTPAAAGVVVNVGGVASEEVIAKAVASALKAAGIKDKDTQSDGDSTTDKPKKDDTGKDAAAEGFAGLKDVIDAVKAMAKDKSLPDEARARAGIVLAMLNDVSGSVGATMKTLAQAGKDMDITGAAGATAELVAGAYAKLCRAMDEVNRICEVEGVSEAGLKGAQDAANSLGVLTMALAELGGMKEPDAGAGDDTLPSADDLEEDPADVGDDADPEADPDADADADPEDDADADPDAERDAGDYNDSVTDADNDGDDDADTDDDDTDTEPKAEDEDDTEPKSEDDTEDADDKDEPAGVKDENDVNDGEPNPGADPDDDDADAANPEVGKGKRAAVYARKLLGKLVGGAKLDAGTLAALRTVIGGKSKKKTTA